MEVLAVAFTIIGCFILWLGIDLAVGLNKVITEDLEQTDVSR